MLSAFYNDTDPFVCAWLSNLMDAGLITPGRIDGRPIQELSPTDVAGFGRVHLFSGVAGWDRALNLAEWGDEPVWTGSCPCQPFSVAGQGKGETDARHLWPEFYRLIRQCRPATIFGEQVEAAIGHGWLDLVQTDLEREGYAVGAAVLPAASIGAFHARHRLFFVADALICGRYNGRRWDPGCAAEGARGEARLGSQYREFAEEYSPIGFVADALPAGRPEGWAIAGNGSTTGSGKPHFVGNSSGAGLARRQGEFRGYGEEQPPAERAGGTVGGMDDAGSIGRQEGRLQDSQHDRLQSTPEGGDGFWADCDWLPCRDGKARPVESGTFPLASGLPARVGRLRGYGNAIVPQVAAEFIRAYREARDV